MGSPATDFLLKLIDPQSKDIAADQICAVMAHPDDETLGFGAQLRRLEDLTLVLVTDGAPRSLFDANANGFATAADYAACRRSEFHEALRHSGIRRHRLMTCDIPDQETASQMSALIARLADLFSRKDIRVVLTHAFEGGHPDHDAAAFAAHAAARRLRLRGMDIDTVEMPYYRLGPDGMLRQSFADAERHPPVTIRLAADDRARKARMVAAYATQQGTLQSFSLDCEQYRIAPDYDLMRLPNGGRLLYERFPWGMSGERWSRLAKAALRDSALQGEPC